MTVLQGALMALAVVVGLAPAAGAQERLERISELPGDAREALSKTWDHWSLSTTVNASCAIDGGSAGPLLTTDLDNDGHDDFVAVVETPDGQRLVAAVYRLTGYEIYDLDPFGGAATGAIAVERRGMQFTPTNGSDDFFPANTVVVRHCDGKTTGYLWGGVNFRKTAITR